jgi:Fic family protein
MSRLLTLLLLYRCGYIVGKYVSVEKMIEKSKETYYDVLQESSQMWHEEQNNYLPFVEYTLGIILATYSEFTSRVSYLSLKSVTKNERIRIVIKDHLGKISKREIIDLCPDISPTTIEAALSQLVKDGIITKVGKNRYTQYFYNQST